MCVHVSTSLESPPIMGNLRCDWAPLSNRFYLVYTFKENGLKLDIGSGVCLCVGKVLGTPPHPFKKTVTSLLVFPFIC